MCVKSKWNQSKVIIRTIKSALSFHWIFSACTFLCWATVKRTIDIVIKIRSANWFLFFTSSRILPLVFHRSVNTYRISSTCLYMFARRKVSILKIPDASSRRGSRWYWKSYRGLLIYYAGIQREPDEIFGGNFFMIIQFILRSRISGRAECISFVVTRDTGYIPVVYRHSQ